MSLTEVLIAHALDALRAGEVVVYPTETVYAIGVDALSSAALERLFALKGREASKAVALITDSAASAFSLASEVPASARVLAAAFWPGPLTLVLPARAGLPDALVGPEGGVGVRVSPNQVAIQLAARLGRPLTATSANPSGQPSA
ncbi:MAG: L-threonylcarbamoyladenylate synthase, partial [Candidatus Binataceae bacterium]